VLSAGKACREAVRAFLAWQALEGRRPASPRTTAYCNARRRLRQRDLDRVRVRVARKVEATVTEADLWCGRRVRVVDGSALSMPDTPENQHVYPQHRGQKPGCGFPVMRVVALFSLATGVLLDLAKASLRIAEQPLFRTLWHRLAPGDVVLGDRGFCSYAALFALAQRGVDSVVRTHPRRTRLSLVRRLGRGDRLIRWHKSPRPPAWLSREAWQQLPDRLLLRELTFPVALPGFRTRRVTVVTTLRHPAAFPAPAFRDLYRRRWLAELFLRDIKTTLGMDILRCKTPDMVHRELAMYLIAYNLLRALMREAALAHGLPVTRISFQGTVATVRQWAPTLADPRLQPADRRRLTDLLLTYLARDPLPHRPNRTEPRARKRRPKNYQLLTQPRHIFKEIPHRNKYRKPLS
jgi:hypothetical protein